MAPLTGHPIERPGTPQTGALRVHELLEVFDQAQKAWSNLMHEVAAGYASAWSDQNTVLDGVKNDLQKDQDRAMFVLSILTAGFAGGLLGGIASGALKNMKEPSRFATFAKNFATNAASDAASQFGGSAVSFFQSHPGNPFKSPGVEPSQFAETMQGNVGLFFQSLTEQIGSVISDFGSGKYREDDGEQWYQWYMGKPLVKTFPSTNDIRSGNYETEASLCLWLTWGAERDIPYWNKAWDTVQGRRGRNPFDLAMYVSDIKRWDTVIEAQIKGIEPHLVNFIQSTFEGDAYVDLRKLKTAGTFSSIQSAQTLSRHFSMGKGAKSLDAATELLQGMAGPF